MHDQRATHASPHLLNQVESAWATMQTSRSVELASRGPKATLHVPNHLLGLQEHCVAGGEEQVDGDDQNEHQALHPLVAGPAHSQPLAQVQAGEGQERGSGVEEEASTVQRRLTVLPP